MTNSSMSSFFNYVNLHFYVDFAACKIITVNKNVFLMTHNAMLWYSVSELTLYILQMFRVLFSTYCFHSLIIYWFGACTKQTARHISQIGLPNSLVFSILINSLLSLKRFCSYVVYYYKNNQQSYCFTVYK